MVGVTKRAVRDGANRREPTRDTMLGGRLVLWQPARGRGYRFNLDPVLLYGFAPAAEHVLDLGAGCGVLGMLLLATGKARRVTAVEIQEELCELARRSARENRLEERYTMLAGDLRNVPLPRVDAVVFNPPYFRAGEGRPPPDPGRGAARHERFGTLADFVRRAFDAARVDAPVSAVVPAARGGELEALLAAAGAAVTRRRAVVARAGQPTGHVLVEARRASGLSGRVAVIEEPPLVVHAEEGRDFAPEVQRLLEPPA